MNGSNRLLSSSTKELALASAGWGAKLPTTAAISTTKTRNHDRILL